MPTITSWVAHAGCWHAYSLMRARRERAEAPAADREWAEAVVARVEQCVAWAPPPICAQQECWLARKAER